MLQRAGSKMYQWLHERYDLTPLQQFVAHKTVPKHRHSVWYLMGGITLFLFAVQVFTGIMLLFYYQPGAESSYESVRFIMTKVRFGWLFRSIHNWSANLMVFFAFAHMFSVFFMKAYKKPRELTWITGMLLLAVLMGLGFSGYLLPWDELAFFATKVGTGVIGAMPVLGETMKEIVRGGSDVTGATLSRFYAFHIALLPGIFSAVLGLHLFFIQRQGIHAPDTFKALPATQQRQIPFFPNFMMRDLIVWLVVLNVLIYLAVFWPVGIGVKADPFSPAPEGIRPEWYFLFMFQTLKMIPAHVWFIEGEILGVLFINLVAVAWILIPFWEIKAKPGSKIRPMTVIGLVAIIYMVVMTILGYVL